MAKVVDTDIFIDFLRGKKAAVHFFEKERDVVFCAITESELLCGEECSDHSVKERLLHFLGQFEKVPVDNPLVIVAADIRRETGILLPDAIIAATALQKQIPLVSRNRKDFGRVPGLIVDIPY